MKDIKMIPIVFYFTWAISNAVKENDLVLLKWPPKVESESSKNKLHWQIQQSACALCKKEKCKKNYINRNIYEYYNIFHSARRRNVKKSYQEKYITHPLLFLEIIEL